MTIISNEIHFHFNQSFDITLIKIRLHSLDFEEKWKLLRILGKNGDILFNLEGSFHFINGMKH